MKPPKSRLRPRFRINAAGSINGEKLFFGGVMTAEDGAFIATVSGILDGVKVIPKRQRRPHEDAVRMAVFMHYRMTLRHGLSEFERRVMVARAIHRGNPSKPENQERNIRRDLNDSRTTNLCRGFDVLRFESDDPSRPDTVIMAVGITSTGDGVQIDGDGWFCQWGMRRAVYGRLTAYIPLNC